MGSVVRFSKADGLPALGEGRVLSQRAGFARWLKVRAHHASFVVTITNHAAPPRPFGGQPALPKMIASRFQKPVYLSSLTLPLTHI